MDEEDRFSKSGAVTIEADASLEEIEAMLFDDMVERGVSVEEAAEVAPKLAANAAAQRDAYVSAATSVAAAQQEVDRLTREVERLQCEMAVLQRRLRLVVRGDLLALLIAGAVTLLLTR